MSWRTRIRVATFTVRGGDASDAFVKVCWRRRSLCKVPSWDAPAGPIVSGARNDRIPWPTRSRAGDSKVKFGVPLFDGRLAASSFCVFNALGMDPLRTKSRVLRCRQPRGVSTLLEGIRIHRDRSRTPSERDRDGVTHARSIDARGLGERAGGDVCQTSSRGRPGCSPFSRLTSIDVAGTVQKRKHSVGNRSVQSL